MVTSDPDSLLGNKWYSKLEFLLDITPESLPNYYLVMAGPKALQGTTKGGIRPLLITYVFD